MGTRLQEIIRYKTGGRQTDFANLMGWTPQYLAKLIRGDNFGIRPVVRILETMPEINARWLLLGQGQMLEQERIAGLYRGTFALAQAFLDIERFIPYMTEGDIHELEQALSEGRKPVFSPDKLSYWQGRVKERDADMNARFAAANTKSDIICKQKIVRK